VVQQALGESFNAMTAQRTDLAARKQALQDQQQEEQDLLQIQVLQQRSLKDAEKQKKDLVTSAKGQESIYQKLITAKKQTAAQIETALFNLRDTTAVSFGDMYSYAKEASQKTGVRPAFILAILSEESNLGQNLGSGNWRIDMNPTRDQPIFQEICAALGLNPDSMPVSKKPWYGWGGAMGPAQFIPSTWKQYINRIASISGQNPPNPWNPHTATFAAAMLLADNGADQQTPKAERLAALRYLAGWKNATKSAYAFYGNEVMDLADKYQQQINILGQ
jgi:membrane-bound lytic murein transglycosylase B